MSRCVLNWSPSNAVLFSYFHPRWCYKHMILFDSFFFLVGVILKRVVLFQHIQHLHRGRQQHANAFPLYTPAHVCIVNNSPLQCTFLPGRDGGGGELINRHTHTHRESIRESNVTSTEYIWDVDGWMGEWTAAIVFNALDGFSFFYKRGRIYYCRWYFTLGDWW